MKILLTAIGCAITCFAFAQQPDLNRQKQKYLSPAPQKVMPYEFHDRLLLKKEISKPSVAHLMKVLPNGSKLYALPQDKMPCLAPAEEDYNMPVVAKGMKLDERFPNVVKPQPIIPGTK